MPDIAIVGAIIVVALIFDFVNGFHDAANSIATVVSTRVLSPRYAVMWAAFFNFIAFLFFGLHVAETIGKGIITPDLIDPAVIFGALIGAIVWNVITWALGIPSSSSHALIGGLLGAGIAKAGLGAVESSGVIKTVVAIFLSPTIGMIVAVLMVLLTSWLFKPVAARTGDRQHPTVDRDNLDARFGFPVVRAAHAIVTRTVGAPASADVARAERDTSLSPSVPPSQRMPTGCGCTLPSRATLGALDVGSALAALALARARRRRGG
jgi:PiT family inorganic phosphate transporter